MLCLKHRCLRTKGRVEGKQGFASKRESISVDSTWKLHLLCPAGMPGAPLRRGYSKEATISSTFQKSREKIGLTAVHLAHSRANPSPSTRAQFLCAQEVVRPQCHIATECSSAAQRLPTHQEAVFKTFRLKQQQKTRKNNKKKNTHTKKHTSLSILYSLWDHEHLWLRLSSAASPSFMNRKVVNVHLLPQHTLNKKNNGNQQYHYDQGAETAILR